MNVVLLECDIFENICAQLKDEVLTITKHLTDLIGLMMNLALTIL